LNFFIGINKKWRDGGGNLRDIAAFPRCVAWGKIALFIEKYFHKGSPILIEGELRTHSYKDNDGKVVYVTDVWVRQANFAGGNQSDDKNTPNGKDSPPYSNDDYDSYAGTYSADTPY
jgi:single-strand DNA-binding protein